MIKTIALLVSLLTATIHFAQHGEWELEKDEDGIKVYTRTVEGENIRELKAVTKIKATRKTIASIIVNIDDYENWYPDISKAEIVKQLSPTSYYVYSVLDLPWPATDRDGISEMNITKTKNRTIIALHSVKDVMPKEDDYVRISKSYGFWKLDTDGEYTHVRFQYFARPSGSLPDWIINMFIVDNPFETLQLLKEKAEDQ